MKHKIDLTKEFSTVYGAIRLIVRVDDWYSASFAENEMGEAINYIAEKEKVLKNDTGIKEVLHVVEIE